MNRVKGIFRHNLIKLGLCALLLLPMVASARSETVSVIANPEIKQNTISLQDLRSVYSLRVTRWPNNQPIQVFVFAQDNAIHKRFAKDILDIFPYQLKRYWDRLVYSGVSSGPKEVHSLEEMLDKVANTPGAIGYVIDTALDDKAHELVVKQ